MTLRKPVGLGLLVAATALVVMAMGTATASAEPCESNEETEHVASILCSGGGEGEKIRDNLDAALVPPGHSPLPEVGGVVPGGFGASALAVNTKGPLRFCATSGVLGRLCNENPTGYAFFGIQLDRNPETSCQSGNEEATGWVEFADIQNATTKDEEGNPVSSPVYAGTAPHEPGAPAAGGYGPWPISVRSDHCEDDAGKVTVSNVTLLFPNLVQVLPVPVAAAGTFTGTYEQPGDNCPAGGVELDTEQPGVETNPSTGNTSEVDNGTDDVNAFLCFVSANNYVYPETAPTWTPLVGSIWKD